MSFRPIAGSVGSCEHDQRCSFQWLLDCDFGGWVPRTIVEMAMPFAQVVVVYVV